RRGGGAPRSPAGGAPALARRCASQRPAPRRPRRPYFVVPHLADPPLAVVALLVLVVVVAEDVDALRRCAVAPAEAGGTEQRPGAACGAFVEKLEVAHAAAVVAHRVTADLAGSG